MPAIANLTEPLGDEVISLRLSAERDIPEILIAYQDDPRMHERLGEERPPSGAELGRRSERAELDRLGGRYVELTIVESGADDCVGQVRIHSFEWNHARADLGLWVAPRLRGRGLAPRALRLAAGWLFEACGTERAQILTEPDNEPMLRAARAAGFLEEGLLRGYTYERGDRVDCVVMSLLPADVGAGR